MTSDETNFSIQPINGERHRFTKNFTKFLDFCETQFNTSLYPAENYIQKKCIRCLLLFQSLKKQPTLNLLLKLSSRQEISMAENLYRNIKKHRKQIIDKRNWIW